MDLSQNEVLLPLDASPHMWSYNLFTKGHENLDEILSRHVAIGTMAKYENGNNEFLYKAKEITEWLLQNTLHIPPKALLQVLGIHESNEVEEQRARDNQIASDAQIKNSRQNKLHDCIGKSWFAVRNTQKQKPSANDVWKHLEQNIHQYECIQSFEISIKTKEPAIQWISDRGTEQEMSRSTFNNIVSDFNTGKKRHLFHEIIFK